MILDDEIVGEDIWDDNFFMGTKGTPWYDDFMNKCKSGKKYIFIYSYMLDKDYYIDWIMKCAGNKAVVAAVEGKECDKKSLYITYLINNKTYENSLKISECEALIGDDFDERYGIGNAEYLEPFCDEMINKLNSYYSEEDMKCFRRINNTEEFVKSTMEKLPLAKGI